MTTGAPIYLVSACASGEEFVAAFRRYADKTGLFVPVSEPLAPGKRAVVALTLKDGGVMVEGVAEVIASSPKPSALHGRIGMTIRFVEADAPSKTVLAELEKARLSMKPPPPSVPPRPADVPAEPRPVPPAPGGRIDAANALAECVMIGDVTGLRDPGAKGATPPKANQKFVIPSIPGTPGAPKRDGKGTTPPPLGGVPAAPAATAPSGPTPAPPAPVVPAAPAAPAVPAAPIVASPPVVPATPPREDPTSPSPIRVAAASRREDPTLPLPKFGDIVVGASASTAVPAAPVVPTSAPTGPRGNPSPRSKSPTAPPRFPTPVAPLPITKLPAQPAPPPPPEPPRAAVPPAPAAPAVPEGARTAVQPIQEVDLAEPTDISASPPTRDSARPFDVPTVDSGKAFVPPVPSAELDPPTDKPIQPSRASQILAAVPASGDWTITPDAATPTVIPSSGAAAAAVSEPTPAPGPPPGPPTGDWTISLTDAGWGEPQKLAASAAAAAPPPPPTPPVQPKTGNPVMAVASDKLLDTGAPEDKPTSIGPKIEIDPTLMEPLTPMPADDEEADALAPPPAPLAPPPTTIPVPMHGAKATLSGVGPGPQPVIPPGMGLPLPPSTMQAVAAPPGVYTTPLPGALHAHMAQMPQQMPHMPMPPNGPMMQHVPPHPGTPPGGMPHVPSSRMVTDAGTGFFINDTGQVSRYPSEATYALDPDTKKKKQTVLIAIAATIVLLGIVIVILATRGKHDSSTKPPAPRGSAATTTPPSGSDQIAVQPPAGSDTAHGSDAHAVPPPTSCSIDLQSTPAGADVALDSDKNTVLGTTPGTFTLPCDAEAKLVIKKAKYVSAVKAVTATASPQTVNVKLAHQMFSVKVTSSPPSATISVGGKSSGVTPTTIKVPAYEAVTITISKDGYATDAQKLTVKQNNYGHHVTLKKAPRHR